MLFKILHRFFIQVVSRNFDLYFCPGSRLVRSIEKLPFPSEIVPVVFLATQFSHKEQAGFRLQR